MSTIDEKRVYSDRSGAVTVYVASTVGLAAVSVSGDLVGEFGLVARCDARDVAGADGRLAVATDETVLERDGERFAETGFGPASAVGFDGDALLAAGGDGTVARRCDGDWDPVGTVEGVRALDGDLLAAESGVYRVGDGLTYAGLDDAFDVATAGTPRAATADGLYRLGNGWLDELDGAFRAVAADPATADPGSPGRAHAATADSLYEHRDGEWAAVDLPVAEPVVGVAYGPATYAVTDSGTLLANAGDGWRARSVGLPDAAGLAVR